MEKTLDDYKREKRSLENQIAYRKKKNQNISAQIERLEKAYEKVGKIKRDNYNNADKVRDNSKLKNVACNVQWRGKYKNQFDMSVEDFVYPASKDFFDSIDAIHDEIGKALANKRSEYDTGSAILNGLNKAWNSVSSTIRNWFN